MFNRFLQMVLNELPIFHISKDLSFGGRNGDCAWRFSLFFIPVGVYKFYFISYVFGSEFSVFKILSFDDVCKILTSDELNDRKEKFSCLLAKQNNDQVSNQIKFLTHVLQGCSERAGMGYDKINMYTAVYVVFIGFVFYLLGGLMEGGENSISFLIVFAGTLAILVINYGLLILRALKVKGFCQSLFSDFKNQPEIRDFAASLYFDWQSKSNESTLLTSIVVNVEHYAKRSFLLAFLAFFYLTFCDFPGGVLQNHSGDQSFMVFDEAGRFDSQVFSKAIEGIENHQKSIFVVGSKTSSNMDVVYQLLQSAIRDGNVVKIELNDAVDKELVYIKWE